MLPAKAKAGLINQMEKTFLDELKEQAKDDPFAGLSKEETETPADSSQANNDGEDKPGEGDAPGEGQNATEEKQVPFHEHPRWKERERELEELRAFRDQVIPELEALKNKPTLQDSNIPKWFQTLYGNNQEAWEAYQEVETQRKEEIKRELLAEQNRERQEAQAEETKWNNWVENELATLESEGHKFDRNELIKTALDYSPIDPVTNTYDLRRALEILKLKKPEDKQTSDAKKKIADISVSTRGGDSQVENVPSNLDLRHKSWSSL